AQRPGPPVLDAADLVTKPESTPRHCTDGRIKSWSVPAAGENSDSHRTPQDTPRLSLPATHVRITAIHVGLPPGGWSGARTDIRAAPARAVGAPPFGPAAWPPSPRRRP